MRPVTRNFALLLGCFGLFSLLAHGYLENTDSLVTMQGARAWWLRGDPGLLSAAQAEALGEQTPTWPLEHQISSRIDDPDLPVLGIRGAEDRHYVWFPVGHQLLMVPLVAIGEWLGLLWPEAETRSVELRGTVRGVQFFSQLVVSFVSPFFAACSMLVLLALARTLGAPRRTALGVVMLTTLCSQFLPGVRETMSTTPGALFFYATMLAVARYWRGASPRALLAAGVLVGFGVLLRYSLTLSMSVPCLWALVCACRRGRWSDILWLVAGGLPALLALVGLNWLRFGDPTEFGYSKSIAFGAQPRWIGLLGIMLSPGKGLMWFTPLLWVVLPCLWAKRVWRHAAVRVSLGAFVAALTLFSGAIYWASGQCWGVRYMTPQAVLLVLAVLVVARPWERSPRVFAMVTITGLVITAGGLITSYVGYAYFASAAGRASWGPLFSEYNLFFDWRLSPAHGHWSYAALSASGGLESFESARTTEPMFGIEVPTLAPLSHHPTEFGFRHAWWRWLPLVFPGVPWLFAAATIAVGSAGLLWCGLKSWLQEPIRVGGAAGTV